MKSFDVILKESCRNKDDSINKNFRGGLIVTTNERYDELVFAERILKRGNNKFNHDTVFESAVRLKKYSCHFIRDKRQVFDGLYLLII